MVGLAIWGVGTVGLLWVALSWLSRQDGGYVPAGTRRVLRVRLGGRTGEPTGRQAWQRHWIQFRLRSWWMPPFGRDLNVQQVVLARNTSTRSRLLPAVAWELDPARPLPWRAALAGAVAGVVVLAGSATRHGKVAIAVSDGENPTGPNPPEAGETARGYRPVVAGVSSPFSLGIQGQVIYQASVSPSAYPFTIIGVHANASNPNSGTGTTVLLPHTNTTLPSTHTNTVPGPTTVASGTLTSHTNSASTTHSNIDIRPF